MQGCRCWLWMALGFLTVGCADGPPAGNPTHPPLSELAQDYDPSRTGNIAGVVRWHGPIPEVAAFHSPPTPAQPPPREPRQHWKNPNAPRIDTASHGVGDILVFLRGIDPHKARSWHHPPVRIEQRGHQILIQQGNVLTRLGVVRRGEEVEMISHDNSHHMLRFRGASFFTVPFPDTDQVRARTLSRNGVVELSSGAGRFWMRAYLLVDDHPYYARTEANGRFSLDHVPEGDYELSVWSPSWHVANLAYDPGWNLTTEMKFCPPVEVIRRVKVRSGQTEQVEVTLTAEHFKP